MSETVMGVVDPDYARFLTKARIIARQEGYAIAIHGSLTRDFDVIAVPWTAEASSPKALVCRISFNTGWYAQRHDGGRAKIGEGVEPAIKEHGRMVWSLLSPNVGFTTEGPPDPRWIDFSVMPRIEPQPS